MWRPRTFAEVIIGRLPAAAHVYVTFRKAFCMHHSRWFVIKVARGKAVRMVRHHDKRLAWLLGIAVRGAWCVQMARRDIGQFGWLTSV